MSEYIKLRELYKKVILPPLRAAGFWDYSDYYGGQHMQIVRAGCVKPYSDRLLVAVQFIDSRAIGNDLFCRVWLVPWDHASDSLERLRVGLQMVAFADYEVTEEFAAGIAQRVIAIDQLVPILRSHVLAELASPPIPSSRAEVYFKERRMYELVKSGRDEEVLTGWQSTLADVTKIPTKQLKASKVKPHVAAFVERYKEPLHMLRVEAGVPVDYGEHHLGVFDVEAFYSELLRRQTEE
jgi:hypothetical protein